MTNRHSTTTEHTNPACHGCGQQFTVKYRYRTNKYCSRDCFKRSRKPTEIICPICLTSYPKHRKGGSSKRVYCGKTCYQRYQAASWIGRTCKQCGATFQARRSALT